MKVESSDVIGIDLLSAIEKSEITSVHTNKDFIGRGLADNQIMYFYKHTGFKLGSLELDTESEEIRYITFCDVMQKGKIWAMGNGYFINSGFDVTGKAYAEVKYNVCPRGFSNSRTFYADIEFDAVIYACQKVYEHIRDGGFL